MSSPRGSRRVQSAKRSSRKFSFPPQVLFAAIGGVLVTCSLLAVSVSEIVSNLQPGPSPEATGAAPASDTFEQALRQRVTADPTDAQARDSLANLLSIQGNNAEAFTLYAEAVALEPENVRIRLDFGQALAAAGNQADAELQFRRAVDADPTNADAYYLLGELYRRWQPARPGDAASAYAAAIAASPASVSAEESQKAIAALGELGTPAASGNPAATPIWRN